jgi:hypothetical protein
MFAHLETANFERRMTMMHPRQWIQLLTAQGKIPASRAKDFNTALQKLADASHIPIEDLDLAALQPTYRVRLKTYFTQLSPVPSIHTQRNTLQNLAQLYRAAEQVGLLSLEPPAQSTRIGYREASRLYRSTSPYKPHYTQPRYGCPVDQWPRSIVEGWERWRLSRAMDLRDITQTIYDERFAAYVGYSLTIERPPIEHWDQLFSPQRLMRFITWHAKRVGGKPARTSVLGRHVASLITMVAEHDERPESAALRKLRRKLPKPAPMHHTKRPEHTFTLQELDAVGLAFIEEGKRPHHTHPSNALRPGLNRAISYQTGLLIRLWIRVPMRSRSIREMDLDGRLYRDSGGQWQLSYVAEQLKIAEQEGVTNEFTVPWPPELVEPLETYLKDYRSRFPHADTDRHVFLTQVGRPFSAMSLWMRFHLAIYRTLKKRIWPHLLRTIWADAYIDTHPGDYEGAAAMLNNSPDMVRQRYRRFRREQHLQKAIDFNAQVFGNGHGGRTSRAQSR